MSHRLVRIQPLGGLGNRMLQLMFAEAVRLAVDDVVIVGNDLPEWGIAIAPETGRRAALAIECRAHVIPLSAIVALMRSVPDVELQLRSVASRYAYFRGHRLHHAGLFGRRAEGQPIAANELAISVRLGDILVANHSEYFPMPIAWYEQLIDETGLAPVFVGQIADDRYSAALRRHFAGARFLGSTPAVDFETLRTARQVALSISTFSWLAAWLSSEAETIHLPVAGLFHPGARPDVDLLPLDDARYRFHQSDLRHWRGTAAELDDLIAGRHVFVPISADALARSYAPHIGTEGLGIPDVPVELGPGGLLGRATPADPQRLSRVIGAVRRRLVPSLRGPT